MQPVLIEARQIINTRYIRSTECDIWITAYQHDPTQPALQLTDSETHESMLRATVCVEDPEFLGERTVGEVTIKDWSENEGIVEELQRLGIIEGDPRRSIPMGYVTAEVYMLAGDALKRWKGLDPVLQNTAGAI